MGIKKREACRLENVKERSREDGGVIGTSRYCVKGKVSVGCVGRRDEP